jgi:lambda family phage portal protein
MLARVRDLIKNEPSLGNASRSLAKHVVATGMHSFAEAVGGDGEPLDDFNFEVDENFERWADEEADAEGRLPWWEMQWHALSDAINTGDALLLKCVDKTPGRISPVCYQQLDIEQLDSSRDQPAGPNQPRIARGIELDARNRPIAYWLYGAHPFDSTSGASLESVRVPASRVLHWFVPFQRSATRGVSWFHALVRVTRDLDWYYGNELTSAALAALLVMIHKQEHRGTGGMGLVGDDENESTSDEAGNPLVKWGRGIVANIGPNDDIKIAESSRPNRDAVPFMKHGRLEQAMGAGMSYLALTGDFSQTSFTSAHGAANEDDAYFRPLQQWFGKRLVLPVYRQVLTGMVAAGSIQNVSATQFRSQPRRWLRAKLQCAGRAQLDPTKQTEAAVARIRAGLSTLEDEAGSLGKHWRKLILQRKREQQFAESHGVTLDFSKGASEPHRNQQDLGAEVVPEVVDPADA